MRVLTIACLLICAAVFKGRSISLNHTVGTWWEDEVHLVRHPVPECDMCGRDLCKRGGQAVIVTKEYMDSLTSGPAFNCSMAGVPDGLPSHKGCNAVGQYAVMKGRYKILVGGGGTPNDWYHDGLPYNGSAPTPNNGCLVACQQAGCLHVPNIQVFDVFADPSERTNLAASNASLVAELMELVRGYNDSLYVEALSNDQRFPVENTCPFVDENGVLTPCLS